MVPDSGMPRAKTGNVKYTRRVRPELVDRIDAFVDALEAGKGGEAYAMPAVVAGAAPGAVIPADSTGTPLPRPAPSTCAQGEQKFHQTCIGPLPVSRMRGESHPILKPGEAPKK